MEAFLHNEVWRRFIRMPYGHIMDSADLDGNAVIPTAEECKAYLPSILSWTTPIADGAMFGGLYLYALCEKYEMEPTEALKKDIQTLIGGLLMLADISKVDGFIARGVADDGITHYPCSSNDQTGPWILGLWKAMHGDCTDEATKEEIRKRLLRTLRGFHQNGWVFRNEWEGTAVGSYKTKDFRNCAKFLFAAAVARELAVITDEEFFAFATEIPAGGYYSRREILARGYVHEMLRTPALSQFWITVCAHLSLEALCTLDPAGIEQYERGVSLGAFTASFFIREFDKYSPDAFPPYDHDWRKVLPDLKPATTYEEILAEGMGHVTELYGNVCPLRGHERTTLGQALFSIWIAVASRDKKIAGRAYECLLECAQKTDWDKVGQCYAFVAESAMIAYRRRHKA